MIRIANLRRIAVAAIAAPLFAASALAGGGAAAQPASTFIAARSSSNGPVAIEGIQIQNFGVVDGHIFRGEQPRGNDWRDLASIGVKTVIDLQAEATPDS